MRGTLAKKIRKAAFLACEEAKITNPKERRKRYKKLKKEVLRRKREGVSYGKAT